MVCTAFSHWTSKWGMALALLVLWKHRANIDRLLDGTEPRVGGNKREKAQE